MNGILVKLIVWCSLFSISHCATTLSLTSEPQTSSGVYCPGPVTFTCVGTEIGSLFWLVNGQVLATYAYRPGDEFRIPLTPTLNSPPTGYTFEITDAFSEMNLLNVTAVFSVEGVTVLNGSSVECEEVNLARELTIHVADIDVPPYPSFSSYSLLPSPGDKAEARAEVSLQWSTSFTSQYAVERYHVSVNPDPSSCSSDQVSPSEDYSCSGLVLGTHYTFTVSAFNCGDQEGERSVFNISLCGMWFDEPTHDNMTPAVPLSLAVEIVGGVAGVLLVALGISVVIIVLLLFKVKRQVSKATVELDTNRDASVTYDEVQLQDTAHTTPHMAVHSSKTDHTKPATGYKLDVNPAYATPSTDINPAYGAAPNINKLDLNPA